MTCLRRGPQSKHSGGRRHRGRAGNNDDDDSRATQDHHPRITVGQKKVRPPRPPRFDLVEVCGDELESERAVDDRPVIRLATTQ